MGDTPRKFDPVIIGYLKSGQPVYSVSGGSGDPGGGEGGEGGGSGETGGAGSGSGEGGDGGAGASDKGAGAGGTTFTPEAQAEIDKWKGLSRKHEGNSKSNADAAKKLKELEDADKTEVQRLNEQAAADQKRADEAEGRALRLEVGIEKGLTPGLAKRLVGSNREELEADADELLSSMGSGDGGKGKEKDGKPGGGVKEKLGGGGNPEEEVEENDPRKLAAKVPRPD